MAATPFTTIKLDKVYKLKLGYGAMSEYEQVTGAKIMDFGSNAGNFQVTMDLLWIMLKQDNEELTLKEAMKLVDNSDNNIMDTIKIVSKVYAAAFFDKDAPVPTKEVEEVPNENLPLFVISPEN